MSAAPTTPYARFLVAIAGLGGLLYGIDVGIIAAALLYLNKTINLSVGQTSAIVAAVLGGSMLSSPVTGFLADRVGRKPVMLLGGLLFIASVGIIVLSQSFTALFVGRLLQGISGGVIAVAVPLFLAESLGPEFRGRGTGIFQFMLTFGIVLAAAAGFYYTHGAEAAIAAAHGDAARILAAQNHAWRGMFLSVIYPGVLFFAGCFFLSETPRWLFTHGRREAALLTLERTSGEAQARAELAEMEALAAPAALAEAGGSLLRRRYILPFALACAVLALNQFTGINSVLGYMVVILRQAGLDASHASAGDVVVKLLNMLMTVFAVAFVDRRGRRFLLRLGTGGIVLALLGVTAAFYTFESHREDVSAQLRAADTGVRLAVPVASIQSRLHGTVALTVVYNQGEGDHSTTALSTDPDPVLRVAATPGHVLVVTRAALSPVPGPGTGILVAACLVVFISAYAAGPGVVVWLMLSELMPTRIRSAGMGLALLLNQGASTAIAGVFLPIVSRFGYSAIFLFLAACTGVYFLIATFALPETKGKSLEEIEVLFDRSAVSSR